MSIKTIFTISILMIFAPSKAQAFGGDFTEIENKILSHQSSFPRNSITIHRNLEAFGLPDFYEAEINNQQLIVHKGGRYVFLGDLFDISEMSNLSEIFRNDNRARGAGTVISELDRNGMIRFKHAENARHRGEIFVFFDPQCPFSQRVHKELDIYREAGVNVSYIPYPRPGVQTTNQAADLLAKALCSTSPLRVLDSDNIDSNEQYIARIDGSECYHYVEAGYQAGQSIRVQNTPVIYLSNGQVIPGYNPARAIVSRFDN